MRQYNKTKGIKGLKNILNQFDEALLKPWQRDLLRERLLILDWHDRNGTNVTNTAQAFNSSRYHVTKLLKLRQSKGLRGLIPKPKGPKSKRGFKLSHEEKMEINRHAEMFPDWGHKKLHIFLSQHSKSTLYRYLSSRGLLVRDRCPGFHKKTNSRSAWNIKRKKLPKGFRAEKPGDLVVLDSIVEYIGPRYDKLYFITCVDIATRIGFAMAMKVHNSKAAKHMLSQMETILQTPIKAVLTDNGAEFLAQFHQTCDKNGIEHFFTRPRTPKDNAIAERFNLTLQQHLYWRVDLNQSVDSINQMLKDWLIEYNCFRPHESLNMRPPAAHYFNLFYSPRIPDVYSKLWNRTYKQNQILRCFC